MKRHTIEIKAEDLGPRAPPHTILCEVEMASGYRVRLHAAVEDPTLSILFEIGDSYFRVSAMDMIQRLLDLTGLDTCATMQKNRR